MSESSNAASEFEEYPWLADEGLFARDFEGRLIRMDRATAEDLDRDVTLTIDGKKVTVKKAVPAADDVGRVRTDAKGNVLPRATTIFDAASQLFGARVKQSDPDPLPSRIYGPRRGLPGLRGADRQVQGAYRQG